MKLKLKGLPDDLIKRCDGCDYCIFEDILSEDQRKIKVLDLLPPKNHPHRATIEEICGKNYDRVCPMKYAAMRSSYDDFMASQLGAINNFIWDIGKRNGKGSNYDEAMKEWTRIQDLGNEKEESYAQRFREVWNKGIREVWNNGIKKDQQILIAPQIYEIVVASANLYSLGMIFLDNLKKEHGERDNVGNEDI